MLLQLITAAAVLPLLDPAIPTHGVEAYSATWFMGSENFRV